jgi:uncharacterized protein YfbU (UPF0304 family)
MEPAKVERLILLNQYRILEKPEPDEIRACEEAVRAIFDGNGESNHFSYATFLIETQGK